jgi:hypothetical protein
LITLLAPTRDPDLKYEVSRVDTATSHEVHDQEPFLLLNNFGHAATNEAALCWGPLKRKLKHYFQESVKTVLVILLFALSAENSKVKTYQNLMDWFCNMEKKCISIK